MADVWHRWLRRRPDIDATRWLVLDVETTGLDTRRDQLLAVAAVAVHLAPTSAPRIALGDSFEVVLQQDAGDQPPDKANILLHGIGLGARRQGMPPRQALAAFARHAGQSPLLAFHAGFDRAMLTRAFATHGLPQPVNPWLDLEPVAAALHPQVPARALDDWLAHFGIRCAQRHQAAADVLATAELLLRLWPAARRQLPRADFASLQRLAAQRHWLAGGR